VCEYPQLSGSLPRLITNRDAGCKLGTLGGTDVSGARAQLRYVASDTLSFDLALDYQRDDSGAAADTCCRRVRWWAASDLEQWNGGQVRRAVRQPFRAQQSIRVICDVPGSVLGAVISAAECPEPEGVSSNANWKISDAVDAKLILAWRNWNGRFATDQSKRAAGCVARRRHPELHLPDR